MAEIIKCPNCSKPLQVPENFLGQTVQCPECRHQFKAASTAVSSEPISAPPPPPPPLPDEPIPTKPVGYDDDLRDVAPRGRRSRYDDDEYDEVDDRPARFRRNLVPHRGGMIIALGIIALVLLPCSTIICGPMAWIMGNTDLAEIRAGRMDPAGEGMVQAGRILGMISTGLFVLVMLLYCFIFGAAFMGNM